MSRLQSTWRQAVKVWWRVMARVLMSWRPRSMVSIVSTPPVVLYIAIPQAVGRITACHPCEHMTALTLLRLVVWQIQSWRAFWAWQICHCSPLSTRDTPRDRHMKPKAVGQDTGHFDLWLDLIKSKEWIDLTWLDLKKSACVNDLTWLDLTGVRWLNRLLG